MDSVFKFANSKGIFATTGAIPQTLNRNTPAIILWFCPSVDVSEPSLRNKKGWQSASCDVSSSYRYAMIASSSRKLYTIPLRCIVIVSPSSTIVLEFLF